MSVDYLQLRKNMVNSQLITLDVVSEKVISQFLNIKRELFAPKASREFCYIDDNLKFDQIDFLLDDVNEGQTNELMPRYMSKPIYIAKLIQLCDFSNQDNVLHIGANSGYGSAVIAPLVKHITVLENNNFKSLLEHNLKEFINQKRLQVVYGNLSLGYPDNGLYDVILVEGQVNNIPSKLFDQLLPMGRLVVVEGKSNLGWAKIYVKNFNVVTGRKAFSANLQPLPDFFDEEKTILQ